MSRQRRWTVAEDAVLAAARNKGLPLTEICALLPTRTLPAIQTRCCTLGHYKPKKEYINRFTDIAPPARSKKTRRPCMTCRRPFMSEGNHVRMCNNCRHLSVGPYDL